MEQECNDMRLVSREDLEVLTCELYDEANEADADE